MSEDVRGDPNMIRIFDGDGSRGTIAEQVRGNFVAKSPSSIGFDITNSATYSNIDVLTLPGKTMSSPTGMVKS